MLMLNEQMLMGGLTALLCLVGIFCEQWFLRETRKGQRLTQWFGPARAVWVLRGLFSAGVLLGLLLALDVIRPVQW